MLATIISTAAERATQSVAVAETISSLEEVNPVGSEGAQALIPSCFRLFWEMGGQGTTMLFLKEGSQFILSAPLISRFLWGGYQLMHSALALRRRTRTTESSTIRRLEPCRSSLPGPWCHTCFKLRNWSAV